jgi:hypothetical protein
MQKEEKQSEKVDNKLAAVCGLYCGACSWFIATTEDPERLKRLAAQSQFSEQESKCYGCRAEKRLPYCEKCKMFACAIEQGFAFCSECEGYPCEDLKQFQGAWPHRIGVWVNLEQIKSVGYKQWLKEIKGNYTCPRCQTINSAYDLKCRKCGEEPSCNYVARHREIIEEYLDKR